MGLLDGTARVLGECSRDRRAQLVKRSREQFEAEPAHTPSIAEPVDFHNTRMYSTRRDAAGQSKLVSVKDLGNLQPLPLEDLSLFRGPSGLGRCTG